jgi:DNA-binding response OmpR family regulator
MIRILLVEDEKETADRIAKLLTRKGYEVDVEYDLAGAFSSDISSYRIVLLDILLKGEKSFPLLKKIKSEYPDIPVIIVSAYDNDENITEVKRLKADGIMTKPIVIEQLEDFILSKIKS